MSRIYEVLIRQMEQDLRRSDDLIRRILQWSTSGNLFWEPPADVYETHDAVKVKMELAGVIPAEIQVEMGPDSRTLLVRGVRRDQDPDISDRTVFHQMEVYMGSFQRELPLPPQVRVDPDAVQATYRDGFLLITLPKVTETPAASRQIEVDG